MTNTSHTTGGSTGDSTGGTTPGSTSNRFRKVLTRWTLEETALISKPEIRDAFYVASRHGKAAEFLDEHFPNRSQQAIWQKIWQIEKKGARFCKACGSKLK